MECADAVPNEGVEILYSVGFGLITAVVMKSSVFWDITPCTPFVIKISPPSSISKNKLRKKPA
jgi:hypothetical protein